MYLVLTPNIPDSEANVLVFDCLNILKRLMFFMTKRLGTRRKRVRSHVKPYLNILHVINQHPRIKNNHLSNDMHTMLEVLYTKTRRRHLACSSRESRKPTTQNGMIQCTLSWPPTSQTVKLMFLYSTVSTLKPAVIIQLCFWYHILHFQ